MQSSQSCETQLPENAARGGLLSGCEHGALSSSSNPPRVAFELPHVDTVSIWYSEKILQFQSLNIQLPHHQTWAANQGGWVRNRTSEVVSFDLEAQWCVQEDERCPLGWRSRSKLPACHFGLKTGRLWVPSESEKILARKIVLGIIYPVNTLTLTCWIFFKNSFLINN